MEGADSTRVGRGFAFLGLGDLFGGRNGLGVPRGGQQDEAEAFAATEVARTLRRTFDDDAADMITSELVSVLGVPGDDGYRLPSASFAAAATRSGTKPNLCCSSFSGADAPKVSMPMTRPSGPT